MGWDGICCLDPCPALSPSAGKGLMGEWVMHWDIEGWISLGAPQELSTEALSGLPGLPVSPISKPRELGFLRLLPRFTSYPLDVPPLPWATSQQGRGCHQLTGSGAGGCRGSLGVSRPPSPHSNPKDGGPRPLEPLPGTEHLPKPSLTLSTKHLRGHPSLVSCQYSEDFMP